MDYQNSSFVHEAAPQEKSGGEISRNVLLLSGLISLPVSRRQSDLGRAHRARVGMTASVHPCLPVISLMSYRSYPLFVVMRFVYVVALYTRSSLYMNHERLALVLLYIIWHFQFGTWYYLIYFNLLLVYYIIY